MLQQLGVCSATCRLPHARLAHANRTSTSTSSGRPFRRSGITSYALPLPLRQASVLRGRSLPQSILSSRRAKLRPRTAMLLPQTVWVAARVVTAGVFIYATLQWTWMRSIRKEVDTILDTREVEDAKRTKRLQRFLPAHESKAKPPTEDDDE